MSVQKRDDWGLVLLVDFMNVAVLGVTKSQWRRFAKKFKPRPSHERLTGSGFRLDRMSLDEAIETRREMHGALAFLRLDARQFKKEGNPFETLVGLLNDLKMPTNYQCEEVKKGSTLRPGQALLRTRDGRRWLAQFWPEAPGARELLYTLLAGALINGTMNHLKVCRHCGKYIVVRDIKREFCPGANCKIDYFNRLTINARALKRNRAAGVARAPETVVQECGCLTTWSAGEVIAKQPCQACIKARAAREAKKHAKAVGWRVACFRG